MVHFRKKWVGALFSMHSSPKHHSKTPSTSGLSWRPLELDMPQLGLWKHESNSHYKETVPHLRLLALKAKIVITPNRFLHALPNPLPRPQKEKSSRSNSLINSFNKHLSLIRGLLFPAKDGSCLSGSTEHSTAELPGSARHIMTGTEGSGSEVSDPHPNRGSAFVNTGKERRGRREVLSNWGGGGEGGMSEMCEVKTGDSYHLFRIAVPPPRPNRGPLSRDRACCSGCSFSPCRVFHVHT